jgi:hypothetical protein
MKITKKHRRSSPSPIMMLDKIDEVGEGTKRDTFRDLEEFWDNSDTDRAKARSDIKDPAVKKYIPTFSPTIE